MRDRLNGQLRFLATPRVSKFRIFSWFDSVVLPDDGIYIFARSDDYFFGVVHSCIHEAWARSQGTQVRDRESGFRYTPNTCFETFPFPFPLKEPLPQGKSTPESEALAAHHYFTVDEDPAAFGTEMHRVAIAAAANELNELRECWLNPPEWTETRTLTFPGSVEGPWTRYIDPKTVNAKTGVGTVNYPRLEPRDADCAEKLKKRTLTHLYNERPAWLDFAHKKLDAAVAAAYGWPADLSDEDILSRLLALNLERAAVEAKNATAPKKAKSQREKRDDEFI